MNRTTPNLPPNHPPIPPNVPYSSLLCIAEIEVYESIPENAASPYPSTPLPILPTTNLPLGLRIFLPRLPTRTSYTFGAEDRGETYDVYVPIRRATKKLFELVLDEEKGLWRIDAGGRTVVRVGGVEIQRGRGALERVWVDAGREVDVRFRDGHGEMRVGLWLVKPEWAPRSSLGEDAREGAPRELVRYAGGVERYIWDRGENQVSSKSWRVTDRFTGAVVTAKVYQWPVGVGDREREMRMFAKETVHKSLVRYKEAVMLDGVPAAITDTHDGMMPFAVLEMELPNMHPGRRCRLAADMFRPLFSGIEYLHHNRILHGSITSASVLVQIVDDRVSKLLLVDYSQSFLVDFGEAMPQELLQFEGAEAMEIVASCANLWALRRAPLPNMRGQDELRYQTELAEEHFNIIMHRAAYALNRKPTFFKDRAEPKLREMLARAERRWAQAREAQILNPDMLDMGSLSKAQLENIKEEWKRYSTENEIKGEYPMILTLGHSWVDALINPLQSASRYFRFPTPSTICTKLRAMEGEDPKPWQMFHVRQMHIFQARAMGLQQQIVQIETRNLADYLATCCETYPDLRKAIVEQYDRIIAPNGDMILPEYVEAFQTSLQKDICCEVNVGEPVRNALPSAMSSTLEALSKINQAGTHTINESCKIAYHRPSQMFNITQMHRFAMLLRMRSGIKNNLIRCDNFIEVRGQSSLEGNYVPLQMLQDFANAFQISVVKQPNSLHDSVIHDPSDFSQSYGRLVLVHEGLVGYASLDRRHGQPLHCPTEDGDFAKYPSTDNFLSTLFGDMKVLPARRDSVHEYARPTHWAKYKTVDQMENTMDSEQNGPENQILVSVRDPEAQCHLKQALRDRAQVVSEATTVYKPPLQDLDPDGPAAALYRRAKGRDLPSISVPHLMAESNLQRVPPGNLDKPIGPIAPVPYDPNVSRNLTQIMKAHFQDSPDDPAAELLPSEVVNELAMVNAYRNASPTEVDDASVNGRRAPSTVRGIRQVSPEATPDAIDRFPPLPASLRRHLPDDASSVHWRNSALPLDVRAFDARSFNDFGAQVAPAIIPRTKVGHTKDFQSFYEGQNNIRQRGVTVREHQRAGMSLLELEKMKERDRVTGDDVGDDRTMDRRVDADEDEEMADFGSDSALDDASGGASDGEGREFDK